jgi:hypothetical protein
LKAGRAREAVEHLQRALRAQPTMPKALAMLGEIGTGFKPSGRTQTQTGQSHLSTINSHKFCHSCSRMDHPVNRATIGPKCAGLWRAQRARASVMRMKSISYSS